MQNKKFTAMKNNLYILEFQFMTAKIDTNKYQYVGFIAHS